MDGVRTQLKRIDIALHARQVGFKALYMTGRACAFSGWHAAEEPVRNTWLQHLSLNCCALKPSEVNIHKHAARGFGTVGSHLGLPDAGLASYRDMVERVCWRQMT